MIISSFRRAVKVFKCIMCLMYKVFKCIMGAGPNSEVSDPFLCIGWPDILGHPCSDSFTDVEPVALMASHHKLMSGNGGTS